MDKFLVDLDSVLDKLEAEDADRCSADSDEPCNIVESSLYRNSGNDKSKQVGNNHYHHRDINSVQSNDNNFNKSVAGELDNLLPSQPKSSKKSLDNLLGDFSSNPEASGIINVNDNQIEQSGTQYLTSVSSKSSEKTELIDIQNKCVDSDFNVNAACSTSGNREKIGESIIDSQLLNQQQCYDYESLTSRQDDRIQQSMTLKQTSNEAIMRPEITKQKVDEKIESVKRDNDDSIIKPDNGVKLFEDKPIDEIIASIGDNTVNNDRMDLLSNPSSYYNSASTSTSTTYEDDLNNSKNFIQSEDSLNLNNFQQSSLLISSKVCEKSDEPHIDIDVDESTEEEMTEEEVITMEKELESELLKLNNHSDLIDDPVTTTASLSPATSSSQSSPISSSLSTSSVSPSKLNEIPVAADFQRVEPSSESQLSPANESSTDRDAYETRREEEITNNTTTSITDNNNDGNISSKPIRPASLSLINSNQSDQLGQESELPPSPILNSNLNERDVLPINTEASLSSLGYFKPFWIPDEEASFCMICVAKFTVMKRRHHCRACGKVLCAQCSRGKAPLAYLSFKEARVCDQCLPLLTEGGNNSGQDNSQVSDNSEYYHIGNQHGAEGLPVPSAPPSNHLSGSASTSSASLVTGATVHLSQPQSSSTIQPVSVLRQPSKPRGEPKQVIFSDGIRPGNDLKDDQVNSMSHRRHAKKVKSPPIEKNPSSPGFVTKSRYSNRIVIQDTNGQLPPIINSPSLQADPSLDNLMSLLQKSDEPPITFSLTKNLKALVKLVKLDCCTNEHCWTFTSRNLAVVGQDEIIVVVEKTPEEGIIPRDIFRLFAYIYDSASKGFPFSELSHILNPEGFFGCKDFPGFVFIRPTFQCLNKLTLPSAPFLIGILIHKFEVPWAKLFPLRLVLRLGSKYRCYPCPVVSYRQRRPSYFEIGHTVMDILADFRNFQYTLPVIPGLTIHTEAKRTTVTFPKNRYDKVMKALGSSNEYVLSFGGTFSLTADSHLTCIQNDDGQYHTQTIKLAVNEVEPKITGASFIVFSGALKSSTGMMAKMSVVEDGLLVQVTANTLNSLKSSLKEMNDFTIECGKKDNPTNEESVSLIWGEDDKQFNLRVQSCIDGLSLEGVRSIRMYNGTDFEGEKFLIRWVELFLIQNTELPRSGDGYDAGRAAEIIAQSFCPALVPFLESLVDSKITKIGLRVTLDPDKIGYDVGSNGSPLPSSYVDRLDAALVPVIMGNIAPNMEVRLVIELIFYILVK